MAPGASPGTLALAGSFAQTAAGLLGIELETTASHDPFRVRSTALLTAADAVRLQVTQGVTAVVPEPGTCALMPAGLLAVGSSARTRARTR